MHEAKKITVKIKHNGSYIVIPNVYVKYYCERTCKYYMEILDLHVPTWAGFLKLDIKEKMLDNSKELYEMCPLETLVL